MFRKLFLVLLILSLILMPSLLFSGCGKTVEVASGYSWKGDPTVLEKARQEGRVVLYTSLDATYTVPMIKTAMQEFGITVYNELQNPSNAVAKIKAEIAGGQQICDLVVMTIDYLKGNEAYFEQLGDIPNLIDTTIPWKDVTNPKDAYPPGYVYTLGSPHGISWNSTNIKDADAPKSWADLSDPKYKGKIVMSDPRLPQAGFAACASMLYYGDPTISTYQNRNWLKGVLDNMVITANVQTVPDELIAGKWYIYVPSRIVTPITRQELDPGVPWKYCMPTEGYYSAPQMLTAVKALPHPNATKVLLDYIFSTQGQTAIAQGMNMPVRYDAGVELRHPELYSSFKVLKPSPPVGTWAAEKATAMQNLCKEILTELNKYQ
ncbi:MAG: extracellular solute-binding protein [Chloroflexi bacterium]|nr:extracellular solute-binding protein [Chloroflexota bacterium]